jgi:hypothetical protein
MSGPVTRIPGQPAGRGYSSWGNVATIASSREIPPCTSESAGSPTRSRAPFSSTRPCSSPVITSGRTKLQKRRPSAVRGYTAPIE